MNYANLETSKRLQRVAKYLKDGNWHSTMDVIKNANVCAVSTAIAELRSNGLRIKCKRENDKWLYKFEENL